MQVREVELNDGGTGVEDDTSHVPMGAGKQSLETGPNSATPGSGAYAVKVVRVAFKHYIKLFSISASIKTSEEVVVIMCVTFLVPTVDGLMMHLQLDKDGAIAHGHDEVVENIAKVCWVDLAEFVLAS